MTLPSLALFLLLAQNPAPPASPASIDGVVVKAATGETLSKVTVTLSEVRIPPPVSTQVQTFGSSLNTVPEAVRRTISTSSNEAMQTTASDGKFLFENVKPGTYLLRATAGGYAPAEYGQRSPGGRGTNITLKPGQKMSGASVTMTPEGSVTGRVVDSNGEPLIRALVQAQKVVYEEWGRSLATVQAVPTDDKGQYRLFWLPPGKYFISAMAADDRMRTMTVLLPSADSSGPVVGNLASTISQNVVRDVGTGIVLQSQSDTKVTGRTLPNGEVVEEVSPPVFYPAALEVSAAASIEVRAGETTSRIDITTRTARAYRIRGRIISSVTGQAATSGDVILVQKSDVTISEPVRGSLKSNDSIFEIVGVLPGSYYLFGVGANGPGMAFIGISSVEVRDSSLENVLISGSTPFAIQGHISTAGAISNSVSNPPSYIVRLDLQNPAIPAIGGLTTGNSMPVRQDNFILPISIPADYRIRVTTPPDTYVQSIRLGGQDVLRDGLHMEGPTNETLEVVIGSNAGRLEGVVSDDGKGRKPFANATVVLVPATSLRQQTNLYQTTLSNAEGRFSFGSIAPGAYKVFAWDDVEGNAWFDAEFMRTAESHGREVVIREGAKETIDMAVISR